MTVGELRRVLDDPALRDDTEVKLLALDPCGSNCGLDEDQIDIIEATVSRVGRYTLDLRPEGHVVFSRPTPTNQDDEWEDEP